MANCLTAAWTGAWVTLAAQQCLLMPSSPNIDIMMAVYNPNQAFQGQAYLTVGGLAPQPVPAPPGTNAPVTVVISTNGNVLQVTNTGRSVLQTAAYFPGGPAVAFPPDRIAEPLPINADVPAVLAPFRAGNRISTTMLEGYSLCGSGGTGAVAIFNRGTVISVSFGSDSGAGRCNSIAPANYAGSTVYFVNTSALPGPSVTITAMITEAPGEGSQ